MSALWVFLLLTAYACSTHGQLPTVHINDCGGTIVAGQSCTLVCGVSGIGSSNHITTYQWTKNNGTTQTQVGTNSNTLSFSSLRLSDAGQYTCRVTVGSEMYGYSEYIHIQIPAPHSLTITSTPASPIRPIGTNVTLKCTVELSPLVDVPVIVNIQLSDPDGRSLTATTPSVSGSIYTTIATINSFGREQSGNHTCTGLIRSSFLFLTDSWQNSVSAIVTVGMYLYLGNMIHVNNSIIFVTTIGRIYSSSEELIVNNGPLQCVTDRICCRHPNRNGEWFFPNGTNIWPPKWYNHFPLFYRYRGDNGTVYLNRANVNATFPTGLFCCVVPDITDTLQTLCANIVTVVITHHGMNTAGEVHVLECFVNGTNNSMIFQWLDSHGTPVISNDSITIINSATQSQLQFFPLHQSHTGKYTCIASTGGSTESKSIHLKVNVPNVTVQIDNGGLVPVAGQQYFITCNISGVKVLDPSITYRWIKNNGSTHMQTGNDSKSLFFSILKLSDAGEYSCQINIHSLYIGEDIFMVTSSLSIVMRIPELSAIVTSNIPNPVRPVGSAVTLTCTVDLSPFVDVPVTVNTLWTGPNGFNASVTAQPVTGSSTTYTSTATVSSFGREQSGVYSCNATAESMSSFISSSIQQTGATRMTTGVYLSLKGVKYYTNNSIVTITEIGRTDAYQNYALQCVTDRKPCCGFGSRFGEWYFPNRTRVPIPSYGALYYRLRGDDGTVNLNRLTSDVTHPTGQFCCVVPDATDAYQTCCINIIPSVSVQIFDDGTPPTAEQTYSLNCYISGAENLDPTITYQWIKNNGTQTHVGTNLSILSFSSLRLSDAGDYFCKVIVNSHLLHNSINETSKQFEVHIPVPQPIVRLISDTPNPVHSGSSPILTCAVELSPAVDVPVTISTVWTGPDGSILMSAAPPVMKSFTHYTSEAKLNYVESTDSRNYNCTVSIEGKIRISMEKKIVIGDGMFQLRLMYTDDCRMWYKSGSNEFELYKYYIEEELIEAIESRCKCHFPKANFLKASFSCASSPNLTTYRNTLISTHNFNATQLIGFIQDWVTSAPQINIKDYLVWLDSSCPVAIASLKEPECGEVRQCPCANDPNVVKCMEHLENENFAECINTCI